MADGDIKFARFPVISEIDVTEDITLQSGIIANLFPAADFDPVIIKMVNITGGSGRSKSVIVVVARGIT